MPIESVQMFYKVLEQCAPENLYAASLEYAAPHKYSIQGRVSIDRTSQTVLDAMMAKTQNGPEYEDENKVMREKREQAWREFCFIYGGYIALQLGIKWRWAKLEDIEEKDRLIADTTREVLEYVITCLEQGGYKKHKLSHLIHKTVLCQYLHYMKHEYERAVREGIKKVPFDSIAENLIEDDEAELVTLEFDEDKLDASGILSIIRRVKTRHTEDDYEMFIRKRVHKEDMQSIADDMGIPLKTAYRRIQKFAEAAIKEYYQYKKTLES